MKTEFHISYSPAGSIKLSELTYVIIGAREDDKWIFVRNKERSSWELPAGHIEKNESALNAAKRELYEETGTTDSNIQAIFDYSVTFNGSTKHGRIFLASVLKRGSLPEYEIAEIKIQQRSPEPATYPEAHYKFIAVLDEFIGQLL